MSLYNFPGGGGAVEPIRQTTWWRDHVNGDDRAAGDSANAPIRTMAEFNRRTRGSVFDQNVTLNVVPGANDDEHVSLSPTFDGGATLYVQSEPTVLFTGTLTSSTLSWSDSGHQEVVVACSALPTSWTASGLVGQTIRRVEDGAISSIAKDIGTKSARCQGWILPDSGYGDAASGDEFEVLDYARSEGSWYLGSFGNGRVVVRHIEIGDRAESHSVAIWGNITCSFARLNGLGVFGWGEAYVEGCYIANGARALSSLTIDRCACVRAANTALGTYQGGRLLVYDECLFDAPFGLDVDSGSNAVIAGSASISSSTTAVTMYPGAILDQIGYLWSRDGGTRIYNAMASSKSTYTSGRAAANYGTGSPALGLLGAAAITALPQVNANGQCGIVVRQ